MARLLNGIAVGVVVAASIFVGLVLYRQTQLQPELGGQTVDNTPVGNRNAAPGPPVIVNRPPLPPQPPPKPKRPEPPRPPPVDESLTWEQIEEDLRRLHLERPSRPTAVQELVNYYADISRPRFTGSQDYPEHISKLQEWRRELPDSPTPCLALAKAHLRYAWEARGSGFAGTVSEEGWTLFYSRLTEVRRQLEAALERKPRDGEVYAEVIALSKGEGVPPEKVRGYFENGRKHDPTYPSLYQNYAEYLLPRWHGEPGDVLQMAEEAAEQLPGDDGLEMYLRIALTIHCYEVFTTDPVFRSFDRRKLAQAARVMCRRYPNYPRFNAFAAICLYAAQDRELAKEWTAQYESLIGEEIENLALWPKAGRELSPRFPWLTAEHPEPECDVWYWGGLDGVRALAFTPDSQSLWCQGYGFAGLYLLAAESGELLGAAPRPEGQIRNLALAPNRKLAVAGVRSQEDVWRLALWNLAYPVAPVHLPSPGRIDAIALHPQKMEVAYAIGRNVRQLNLETGVEGPQLYAPAELESSILRLHYSPDGARLAFGSAAAGGVYNTENGKLLYTLPCSGAELPKGMPRLQSLFALDAAGQVLGTGAVPNGSSSAYPLLRVAEGGAATEVVFKNLATGPAPGLRVIAYDPDRQLIATTSNQQQLAVWSLESNKLLRTGRLGWDGTTDAAAFSPDGKLLATASSHSGRILLWRLQ